MDAPKVYPQQDPAKAMNVITIDCRGLEFVEFRADVLSSFRGIRRIRLILHRATGRRSAWSPARSSPLSISQTASGLITTRNLERK